MTTPTEDPWRNLALPLKDGTITGRRVDSAGRFDFFWARDAQGRALLILCHRGPPMSVPLPRLKGLEVNELPGTHPNERQVVWRLLRSENAEIFLELCLDIVASTARCADERAAVDAAVGRTWRWHHFLRSGRQLRLTLKRQVGLLAELLVLESMFLSSMSPVAALKAWRGPLDEPQDFVASGVGVEVKAAVATAGGKVRISSEFQLDAERHEALWLLVVPLESVDGTEISDAITLELVASRVTKSVESIPEARQLLDSLLTAAGYDASHNYVEFVWRHLDFDGYLVGEGFPCLPPGSLPTGVEQVEYALTLGACAEFLKEPAILVESLRQGAQ